MHVNNLDKPFIAYVQKLNAHRFEMAASNNVGIKAEMVRAGEA